MAEWQGGTSGVNPTYDANADQLIDAASVEDGAGSGLDADTLDGSEGADFAGHLEAKVTGSGGSLSASHTWTTAFSTTPVVVAGLNATEDHWVSSRSTTGATTDADTTNNAHFAMAMEPT